MAISSPSATMKKKIEDTTELIMAAPIQSREVFARPATRSAVRRQDDVERSGIARTQFREIVLHYPRNGREGDAPVEKGLDRDFVERVQLRGGGAAARQRLIRQPQTREAREIGRRELQRRDLEQIAPPHAGGDAPRPRQRMGVGCSLFGAALLGV